MLKMTCVRLQKIVDIDIYLFTEEGLKGGISYIAKRYREANNKYIKNYDPKKPSNTYRTLIWVICMVGQWVVIFLMENLSG